MSATRRACRGIVAAILASSAVRADPAPSDGEALFQQGRAAFNDSNYERALSLFEKSQELEPAVGTLLNLAVCEERLGKLTRALAHLKNAMATIAPDDKRRPLIVERLARIEERTPRLSITFDRSVQLGVVVTLDSKPLSPDELREPLPLEVGDHVLNCAGGRGEQCARAFTIAEGQQLALAVSVSLPIEPAAAAPLPKRSPSSRRDWAYAAGSFGLAGIVTGLVAGAGVLRQKSRVSDHCDPRGCDDEGMSAAREGKTLAVISNVATSVGVVSLGVSAWLLLSVPSPRDPNVAWSIVGSF